MRHNQNRRSRGRNNNNRKGPNPLTRSYESNGPDVKVRGTAMHVAEKYMSLARDAQSSGDIVAAENYLQHAEHYNRIVMAAQAQFQQAQQQPPFREGSEEGYDDERQMNGRAPRDRFEFNGDGSREEDEVEGDRFDSTEEEQERVERNFQPQQQPRQQQHQPRQQDDRDRQRGPRPDRSDRPDRNDRFERRDRQDRNDRGPRPDGDRGMRADGDRGMRGEGDRGMRGESANRPDGGMRSDAERGNRPDGERGNRAERFERGESPDERNGQAQLTREQPQPSRDQQHSQAASDLDSPMTADPIGPEAEAAPARRRRGRPPRAAENGAEPNDTGAAETTPDGAAALVAFPD